MLQPGQEAHQTEPLPAPPIVNPPSPFAQEQNASPKPSPPARRSAVNSPGIHRAVAAAREQKPLAPNNMPLSQNPTPPERKAPDHKMDNVPKALTNPDLPAMGPANKPATPISAATWDSADRRPFAPR